MKTIKELVKHMKTKYDVTLTDDMQKRVEAIREPAGSSDFPSASFIAPYRGHFTIYRCIVDGKIEYSVGDTFLTVCN